MMAKSALKSEKGEQFESIEEIMNLPHMEKLKESLVEKAIKSQQSITSFPSVFEDTGNNDRYPQFKRNSVSLD